MVDGGGGGVYFFFLRKRMRIRIKKTNGVLGMMRNILCQFVVL